MAVASDEKMGLLSGSFLDSWLFERPILTEQPIAVYITLPLNFVKICISCHIGFDTIGTADAYLRQQTECQ